MFFRPFLLTITRLSSLTSCCETLFGFFSGRWRIVSNGGLAAAVSLFQIKIILLLAATALSRPQSTARAAIQVLVFKPASYHGDIASISTVLRISELLSQDISRTNNHVSQREHRSIPEQVRSPSTNVHGRTPIPPNDTKKQPVACNQIRRLPWHLPHRPKSAHPPPPLETAPKRPPTSGRLKPDVPPARTPSENLRQRPRILDGTLWHYQHQPSRQTSLGPAGRIPWPRLLGQRPDSVAG